MPQRIRSRHALCAAVVPLAVAAFAPATAAQASSTLRCKSADLRYRFQPDLPKDFGVFKLRITGGSCRTAHRVAKAWMNEFEGDLLRGHVKLPRSVLGYRFTTLPATEAQTYNERGRKAATTIRFDYRVPNG
jgi:hypothetical protein